MNIPNLILDTTVFSNRGFIFWLGRYRGSKLLPFNAAVEVAVGFLNRGKSQSEFETLLGNLHITIINESYLTIWEAAIVEYSSEESDSRHIDRLIGSHARLPGHLMVTDNTEDFISFLGEEKVFKPNEIMELYPNE